MLTLGRPRLLLSWSEPNHDAYVSLRLTRLRERVMGYVSTRSTRGVGKVDSHRSTWVHVRRNPERGLVHMYLAAFARSPALVCRYHRPAEPVKSPREDDVAVERIKLTKQSGSWGRRWHVSRVTGILVFFF